jgi:uncharacterized protein
MPNTRDDAVQIAVDDQCIAGTLVTPGTLIPGVLFVHGWGGSQQQYVARAREVAALGCICLTFDLRGHARTVEQQKTVTREQNLNDVIAAYDALVRQRGVDRTSIAVVGSSYGGYLAAILSAHRPVRWLVLRVPALYKDSEWTTPKDQLRKLQELEAYRLLTVKAAESKALLACSQFKGDAMVVESERDVIIPPQVVANYRAALSGAASLTYRLMSNADHALSSEADQQSYTTILVRWLSEMIKGARAEAQEKEVIAKAPKVEVAAAT